MPLRLPHARPRTVATLAAAACLATIAVAPAASAHSTRGRIALHSTSHRTVVAPAHVHPGFAELHNSGRHEVIVVSGPAHRASELAADTKHDGMAAFNKHFAIRGEIAPHRSIYLRLSRGTLYLIDATRSHLSASTIHATQVSGSTRDATVPKAASLVVRTGPHMSASRSLSHGALLHVTNASKSTQFINFMRVGPHTSDAQLAAFAARPSFDKLFDLDIVDFSDFLLLSAHRSEWTPLAAPRGRYLVMSQTASSKHTPKLAAAAVVVR